MDSTNAGPDGSVIGYMCAIDWEYELGAASGGNLVFPSVDDLKRSHVCWRNISHQELLILCGYRVCIFFLFLFIAIFLLLFF